MVNIQHVSFSYAKSRPVFTELTASFATGNIYGLLGKNGAGKSTFLKLLAGLLFPSNGAITVAGVEPKFRQPDLLSEVFLVTEDIQLPAFSIGRYVQLYAPFYPRFDHTQFSHYRSEFELPENSELSELSQGQKKKFVLSFALATNCRLLLLDEPTNGLDIPSKSQFRKIVANAIDEHRSFIISTHQARDMENLVDPIVILEQGKIIFYESYERISAKVAMSKSTSSTNESTVIYSEPGLGGNFFVYENIHEEETSINLEVLFKAVLANPDRFHKLFNAAQQ
jgi:ABC-2 type transport system ATP-binding protein